MYLGAMSEQIWKAKEFWSDYVKEYCCEPSVVEIARFMWLTLKQVRALQENACMASLRSLDAPVTGADGTEDTTVGSWWRQQATKKRIFWTGWRKKASVVPCGAAWTVCRRSRRKRSVADTRESSHCGSAVLPVASLWPRQGSSTIRALRSLRSGENGKLLRPFLPEDSWIYNNVLIGGGVGRFSHTWTSSTERVALEL